MTQYSKTTTEQRADNYIKQMTLEEKISQMVHNSKAIDRLGINKYNWWNECLHGVARAGIATVFPQAIGMAATWNTELMRQIADVISDEARAKHHEFARQGKHEIYQGLTYWSPNINIFRDPRWGRGMETYGEDPYLTARLAVEFIKGLQGDDPNYFKLIATPKHYAVHSGPEYSRHTFNAVPTNRDLWDTYLPAFEACIKEAKAYSIMGAYNRMNGEACTASNFLLSEVLRKQWEFDGYVVSDAGAITDISEYHKVAGSLAEATAMAVKSGTDLCAGDEYKHLKEAVDKGMITEKEIDVSLKRLMIAKIKLGMFDDPHDVPYASIPYSVVDCEKHKQMALQVARESIVLLKNENNILPLTKKAKTIAVIGPNADSTEVLLGNYHGIPSAPVSLYQGLLNKAGKDIKVIHEHGCELAVGLPFFDVLPAELIFTDKQKTAHGLKVEYFNNKKLQGNPVLTETIASLNQKLFIDLKSKSLDENNFGIRISGYIAPEKSGRYAVGVIGFTSFSLFVNEKLITEFHTIWEPEKVYESIDLEAGQTYQIKLELDEMTSEGHTQKLLWAVPDSTREERALKVASQADVVVLAMGLSPQLEGEEMPVKVEGFKQGDRLMLDLPKVQENFMKKIVALGKPTILVLFNGCAVSINWEKENIPAIIESWYGGQAAGNAIAEVLFGDYNPSGRLPITFYKSLNDIPAFEDYSMEGRTYRYFKGEPLFEFGYGLSYTTFAYTNLQLPQSINTDAEFSVSVEVQNTGKMDGDEVVQLYLSRVDKTEKYPIRSLQGIRKIHLKSGEKKKVEFNLSTNNFSIVSDSSKRIVESGLFDLFVGGAQPSKQRIDEQKGIVKQITIN